MKSVFYSLPFRASDLSKPAFQKVSAEASVRQHVRLILLTLPNQVRFSPQYGGAINRYHFNLPDKRKGEKKLEDRLRDRLLKNLQYLLAQYEPRLAIRNITIQPIIPSTEKTNPRLKGGRIAFDIKIEGKILGITDFQHEEIIPFQ